MVICAFKQNSNTNYCVLIEKCLKSEVGREFSAFAQGAGDPGSILAHCKNLTGYIPSPILTLTGN